MAEARDADETADLRRELTRLRAENTRLSRLLQVRGGDTEPGSVQPAVPVRPPGAVTMMASPEHKLALYGSLFRARTDVYALRWENRRRGTSGWVPAVAGGWHKGMDRRRANYLPLTQEVLAAHLVGDIHMGLYPLLRDNTRVFLAADFDGQAALLDALAYLKAAHGAGAPGALEISQSGRGAHVWLFFTDSVPAARARAVGTGLVREAIGLRGTMSLRSYDRLFPNQDVLPAGGMGNLIAAPLQGRRRRNGLTLFLDPATLEPYADQWAYLSTLDGLTPGEVESLARRLGDPVVGARVTTLDRPRSTHIHPTLPAVVRATLGAGLTLSGEELTPAALSTFEHAASMSNPKFYELQRLRKSTWDTPRFVRGYDVTVDGNLVLPRGLRRLVADIVTEAGSRLDTTDTRDVGREIETELTATLRLDQVTAVDVLLGHDEGILVAPPGSGKTVMACAVVAERAVSTLVMVDRRALADQWRAAIRELLGVTPGQLGGGRKKLTGVVDVALLPTLARRTDVAELARGYGQIVVDECHHLAAPVYDHSIKRIAARYWLGLTATPRRRDGLDDLVTWQLGPVRHTLTPEPGGKLLTSRGELPDEVPGPLRELWVRPTEFRVAADDGELDPSAPGGMARIQAALATDSRRNRLIVDDVCSALERRRNCLVLTRRVAHAQVLAELLTEAGQEPLVLHGGVPGGARREAVARLADVEPGGEALVVGTVSFIGEGFDVPALDTLFLAAPVSFAGLLVQCAGRVVRSCPGKNTAEVHDYHDEHVPVLAAMLRKRLPGYRELGFTRRS